MFNTQHILYIVISGILTAVFLALAVYGVCGAIRSKTKEKIPVA